MKYPHLDAFFTPIDFIRSDRFVFQGSIDNQQPERLITRELVGAASGSASPPEVFTGIACPSW